MRDILERMEMSGWAVTPCFLDRAEGLRLSMECERARDLGAFRRAGVGRGETVQVRDEIRGDEVLWLDADVASIEQQGYLQRLDGLREALNQSCFLGLFRFEGHFAVYPVGAFYRAHLDRHAGTNGRLVTTILYLNADWQPGDGGELRLWTTPGERVGDFVLIEPRLGTLVTFLSGDFWHEVLPAVKSRMSITGWFCRS